MTKFAKVINKFIISSISCFSFFWAIVKVFWKDNKWGGYPHNNSQGNNASSDCFNETASLFSKTILLLFFTYQHFKYKCKSRHKFTTSSLCVKRLNKKCPYSEFFWSIFSRIRTEYGEIRSISPCSVRMRENRDQKISEYGHFLRNGQDIMKLYFAALEVMELIFFWEPKFLMYDTIAFSWP